MPIYEYRCEACGYEMEAIQKISDAPLEVCRSCQAPKLKKKVSAPAFRLKGSGWYETDFKSGNKKNLAGESGEKAKPKEGGEAKTAAKTEKTESKASKSSGKSD